jgi:hypothetical protein
MAQACAKTDTGASSKDANQAQPQGSASYGNTSGNPCIILGMDSQKQMLFYTSPASEWLAKGGDKEKYCMVEQPRRWIQCTDAVYDAVKSGALPSTRELGVFFSKNVISEEAAKELKKNISMYTKIAAKAEEYQHVNQDRSMYKADTTNKKVKKAVKVKTPKAMKK